MDEMPVCRASLFGRVLTHRRDHDAIAQLERAKSVRSEQRAHCLLSLSEIKSYHTDGVIRRELAPGEAVVPHRDAPA